MQKLGYWLILIGIALALFFLLGKFVFPGLVSEFTALIVSALAVVGGLFFRRKKSS